MGLQDETVANLYELCDALILPSQDEGFGLPMLEAALHRLPIFCARLPSLEELGEDRAHYFDPQGDPAQVAAQLARFFSLDARAISALRVRRDRSWEHVYSDHLAPLLEGQ